MIDGNASKPGVRAALAPVGIDMIHGLQKGFMGQIFCQRPVQRIAVANPDEGADVLPVQVFPEFGCFILQRAVCFYKDAKKGKGWQLMVVIGIERLPELQ